jgi:imidazolonepropionase-like amidohydrolase
MCVAGVWSQPAGPRQIVLRAARMFDGKSDALVSPGLVVIEGNKIAGVGATARQSPNAQIIDLGDATLLPGFMDAHVHLTQERGLDSRQ